MLSTDARPPNLKVLRGENFEQASAVTPTPDARIPGKAELAARLQRMRCSEAEKIQLARTIGTATNPTVEPTSIAAVVPDVIDRSADRFHARLAEAPGEREKAVARWEQHILAQVGDPKLLPAVARKIGWRIVECAHPHLEEKVTEALKDLHKTLAQKKMKYEPWVWFVGTMKRIFWRLEIDWDVTKGEP